MGRPIWYTDPVMWNALRLDSGSTVPLYRQLFERIRGRILTGELSGGARLPATRELAGLIGLNRTTISAAYELLEQEGLIHGHVGRGSFVAHDVVGSRTPPPPPVASTIPSQFGVSPQPIISFATSRPAGELFPLDAFRQTVKEVSGSESLAQILQLGSPLGYEPLRQYLIGRLTADQSLAPGDDVLITSGCQQAQDLVVRTLVQPGDLVLLEDPIYPGLREVLHRAGARLAGIPVTTSGIGLNELARALQRERAKLIFVTPTFQNPTGATLPHDGRLELLRLASSYGALVVENDVYSALRYEGAPIPSVKQLAFAGGSGGDVIQLGSFSKVAFPGLRVGWMVAPRRVIEAGAATKQWMDLHSDHLSQAILLRFAETGRLAAHQHRVVESGASKLAAALSACAASLPSGSLFTRPEGGMNLWVRLPDPLDSASLVRAAADRGVAYLPGRYFAVGRPEHSSFRLSFAGLEPARIRAGIGLLGELFDEELRRGAAVRQASAMV